MAVPAVEATAICAASVASKDASLYSAKQTAKTVTENPRTQNRSMGVAGVLKNCVVILSGVRSI